MDVEVAVVGVGDLGRDGALGDLVDVVGGHIQRPDDRIERVVDALDDLAEVALMLGGVGAGGELALHGGLGQHVRVGDERVHHADTAVKRGGQGFERVAHLRGIGIAGRGLDGEVHIALGKAAKAVGQFYGFLSLIGGNFLGQAGSLSDFGLVHHDFQGADDLSCLVADRNAGIGNVDLDPRHRFGDRVGGGYLLAVHCPEA